MSLHGGRQHFISPSYGTLVLRTQWVLFLREKEGSLVKYSWKIKADQILDCATSRSLQLADTLMNLHVACTMSQVYLATDTFSVKHLMGPVFCKAH